MSDTTDDMEQHRDLAAEHSTALATVPAHRQGVTSAQAKVEAVAHLTMAAYERASTLQLTPEEIAKLQADFPDEAFRPGAAGKENLIYIEHAFLRDRLNQVIGIGQWALVPRNRWADEGQKGTIVYVEAMLLVRGCFVSEAVGDMTYYPNNAQTNYGDAVEGAKTQALRRCCKEFGVGLQAWKKSWAEGWWQRRNAPKKPAQPPTQPAPPKAAPSPATISEAQGDTLTKAIRSHGADWNALAAHYRIKRIGMLPANQFADAISRIEKGQFKKAAS